METKREGELIKNPMKGWRRFLNPNPTKDQFDEAWKLIFGFYPKECVVRIDVDESNKGFCVKTPTSIIMNGGFGFHTDYPELANYSDEYSDGYGCSWGVDLNGVRYYRLDKKTGLPMNWETVRAKETILSFIKNNTTRYENNFLITN